MLCILYKNVCNTCKENAASTEPSETVVKAGEQDETVVQKNEVVIPR